MSKRIKKYSVTIGFVILLLAVIYIVIPIGDSRVEPPKNIIFMLFDTMRADHLGVYGYSRNTSPAMDEVARDGVIFEKAFSQSGWTLPSVASFFTGTYPVIHAVREMRSSLSKHFVTLAGFLRAKGYYCAGASNSPIISREKGFSRGHRDWQDGMRDPALTRYAISWLSPDNLSFKRIKEENLLPNSSFQNLTAYLKKHGSSYKYGYFDRQAYLIQRGVSGKLKNIMLSRTVKAVPPGRYHWGLAIKGVEGETKTTVWLLDPSVEKNGIIAEETVTAGELWKMKSFPVKIEKRTDKLVMFIAFDRHDKNQNSGIVIDDVFIIPKKRRKNNERRYVYLHYINPHEPHRIPKETGNLYTNMFKDKILPDRNISESLGDMFDLTNAKFLKHRLRIETWIKMENRINSQNNSFDREIRYMDDQVRFVTDYLKKTGQYDDTMIILTADHGDEFLDHGHVSHMLSVYNELIRIPLIISYPRHFPAGKRIEENVASIDLVPTFVEMLGPYRKMEKKISRQLLGKSLLPYIFGNIGGDERIIFSTDYITRQTAVIFGDKKLIRRKSVCGGKSVLFDLSSDFDEKHDVSDSETELVKMLESSIDRYEEAARQFREKLLAGKAEESITGKRDKNLKKGLMDLGYLDAAKDQSGPAGGMSDSYCDLLKLRYKIRAGLFFLFYTP